MDIPCKSPDNYHPRFVIMAETLWKVIAVINNCDRLKESGDYVMSVTGQAGSAGRSRGRGRDR